MMNYAAFDGFDMRRRGMEFVGSTTIYAFLQAAGYIDAHGLECDLGKRRMSCLFDGAEATKRTVILAYLGILA